MDRGGFGWLWGGHSAIQTKVSVPWNVPRDSCSTQSTCKSSSAQLKGFPLLIYWYAPHQQQIINIQHTPLSSLPLSQLWVFRVYRFSSQILQLYMIPHTHTVTSCHQATARASIAPHIDSLRHWLTNGVERIQLLFIITQLLTSEIFKFTTKVWSHTSEYFSIQVVNTHINLIDIGCI